MEIKLPKTLAACADRLYALKAIKKAAQEKVDAIDAERIALEEHLIRELPKDKALGIKGKTGSATIVMKAHPDVQDWKKLQAYIKKTGAWELLQKRVSSTAVAERWEKGIQVPGIGVFNKATISLTKV